MISGFAFIYILDPRIELVYILSTTLIVVFSIFIVVGIFDIRANYFLNSMTRISTRKVLLTFDDGPDPQRSIEIAHILNKQNVGAIFFLVGKKIEKHPEVVSKLIELGFVVGNHSYSHNNNLPFYSSRKIIEDLNKTEKLLGINSRKIFRPPFGITNPNIKRAIQKLNLKSIGWSIRSFDTIESKHPNMYSRISSKMKGGDILLFHDCSSWSLSTFNKFIQSSKDDGIIFVTNEEIISELNE